MGLATVLNIRWRFPRCTATAALKDSRKATKTQILWTLPVILGRVFPFPEDRREREYVLKQSGPTYKLKIGKTGHGDAQKIGYIKYRFAAFLI